MNNSKLYLAYIHTVRVETDFITLNLRHTIQQGSTTLKSTFGDY